MIFPITNNINTQKNSFRGSLVNNSLKTKADTYMNDGVFDKAIELYEKALQINPNDADVHLNLAKTYSYSNRYREAIPHLEAYIKVRPDDIENMTLLGECYKKSGMFSKSMEYFNRALSIEPNYDYAKRNLLDAQNLYLQCIDPVRGRKERYNTAINNLTEAVKIAKNFFPKGYTDDMKDITVSFDKTSKMGGRSNIAQYEHTKRKISVTDEYTYANPKLTGAYIIHEFVHGKDNDAFTSVREEQDAYRTQAKYWTQNVFDVYDPEMDYVSNLYKQSAEALDERVAEIYRLRDPGIAETSYNHPPGTKKTNARKASKVKSEPLKAYDIIV